jgi:hypothetical protein
MAKAKKLLLSAILLFAVGLITLAIGEGERSIPAIAVGAALAVAGIGVGVWWLAVTPTEVDRAPDERHGADS